MGQGKDDIKRFCVQAFIAKRKDGATMIRDPARQITNSILSLFFFANISLCFNGFISDPFTQSRGLRQGISILQRLDPIKQGAYADDLLALISSVDEWHALDDSLRLYGEASNARINIGKTTAFPMSKWANIPLKVHLASLNMQWHDGSSTETLIYLGFPVLFGSDQTTAFWNKILAKIRAGIAFHSSRSLSVLGRATIVNALILSRLWHLAWVMSFPAWFLTKVRGRSQDFHVLSSQRHPGSVQAPISQDQHYTSRIARLIYLLGHSSRLVVSATNNSSTPLLPRIGDLFSLETDGQEKYRVNHRPKQPAKLQHARDDLLTQLTHTKSRRMSQTYLMAVQSPPVGTSGDLLAKRILSIVLLVSGKTISSWRKFWRAKIPHRARTFWWRYRQDILPCGTLRSRRWGHDPKCDRDGCTEPKADKHHYVLLCDSKFWAWQFILEEHTSPSGLTMISAPSYPLHPPNSYKPFQFQAIQQEPCFKEFTRAGSGSDMVDTKHNDYHISRVLDHFRQGPSNMYLDMPDLKTFSADVARSRIVRDMLELAVVFPKEQRGSQRIIKPSKLRALGSTLAVLAGVPDFKPRLFRNTNYFSTVIIEFAPQTSPSSSQFYHSRATTEQSLKQQLKHHFTAPMADIMAQGHRSSPKTFEKHYRLSSATANNMSLSTLGFL
ncbi:MAG: hypothetical protein J3R72DRAFT_530167 [Linnemannia gamsii]|nr:MAG: hypothetical protein J3R72DRAFT_530167 [Linnemannia gamsii]